MKTLKILSVAILLIINCQLSIAQEPGSGYALDFDGVGDYVNIGNEMNFDFLGVKTNAFTISVWEKDGGVRGELVTKQYQNGFFGDGMGFRLASNGSVTLFLGNNIGNKYSYWTTISNVVGNGLWHNISVVYDNFVVKIYIDGILELSPRTDSAGGFTGFSNNYNLRIAARNGSLESDKNFFDGEIDEVRIWNHALTQTQIQENMCKKLAGNETGLVAYYRMDEGVDNTCSGGEDVCDETGNGNNGTKF